MVSLVNNDLENGHDADMTLFKMFNEISWGIIAPWELAMMEEDPKQGLLKIPLQNQYIILDIQSIKYFLQDTFHQH